MKIQEGPRPADAHVSDLSVKLLKLEMIFCDLFSLCFWNVPVTKIMLDIFVQKLVKDVTAL